MVRSIFGRLLYDIFINKKEYYFIYSNVRLIQWEGWWIRNKGERWSLRRIRGGELGWG